MTVSGTKFTLTESDTTQNWTKTYNKTGNDALSSAEAILEMAANNLTKFSSDPFTGFTVNGSPAGTAGTVNQIDLGSASDPCDSTSSLTSNENFTVTWLNAC